jgi:hypothetical protein
MTGAVVRRYLTLDMPTKDDSKQPGAIAHQATDEERRVTLEVPRRDLPQVLPRDAERRLRPAERAATSEESISRRSSHPQEVSVRRKGGHLERKVPALKRSTRYFPPLRKVRAPVLGGASFCSSVTERQIVSWPFSISIRRSSLRGSEVAVLCGCSDCLAVG